MVKKNYTIVFIAFIMAFNSHAQFFSIAKDINTSALTESSAPNDMIEIGGTVFFSAYTFNRGRELWKSDGTPGGTVVVKDFNAGSATSNPQF
ncbi:MAG: hypothetical protein IPQ25_15210 [Chitinophagaceae bacterium]|nr:hypothetical protein [Chitinophagaceae bacterium]